MGQQQQQRQGQPAQAQRLHQGRPKGCQSVGVGYKAPGKNKNIKEPRYEAFLSLRLLPSGQASPLLTAEPSVTAVADLPRACGCVHCGICLQVRR